MPEISRISDTEKTTDQLLDELAALRQRVTELEAASIRCQFIEVEGEHCIIAPASLTGIEATKLVLERENRSLRATLQQNDRILESISDAFFSLDLDWRYTYINSQAERILGKSRSQLIGKVIWEEFPGLIETETYSLALQAMREQKTIAYEEFCSVSHKWFSIRLYPSLHGLSSYCQDITYQKQAEQELESKQKLLEAVLQQMPAGVIVAAAPSGKIVLMNEQVKEILRGPAPMAETWQDYVYYPTFSPEGRKYQIQETPLVRSLISGESIVEEELEVICGDGIRRTVSANSAPIRNCQGEIIAAVATFADISDRKDAEKAIQLYADVVKNVQFGLTVWEQDKENENSLRLLTANPAATKATKINFAELIGKSIGEIPPQIGKELLDECLEVIRTKEAKNLGDVRYFEEDREEVISIKAFPLPNRCVGLSFENITLPKQIEEALRDALQKLTFHVENSPLAVVEWDRDYRVCRWSQRAEAIFGWKAEEIIGKKPEEWLFVHSEDRQQVAETIAKLVNGNQKRNVIRNRNLTKDGSIVYCEWYSSALFNESSNFESVLCLVLDITDRQIAEDALQEAHQKTFSILETIGEGFTALDSEWRYTYINPQGERILGLRRPEVLGKNIWDLFPGAKELKFYREFERAMQEKVAVHFEEYYQGLNIWFDCHAYPLEGGGICIYYQDISSRKQMEQSLQINRERLDLVLKASKLGVWFCDLPFDKLEWNDKCKAHFGLSPDAEVPIELFYDRLHPDDRESTKEAIAKSITEHKLFDTIYRTVSPEGEVKWIRAIGSGFYDSVGTPIRFDGITVDVSDQKRQEEERNLLLQREQTARQLAELNIWRVLQLQELTAALAKALTLSEVVEVLLNQGLTAFNAQRGWVVQYDANTETGKTIGIKGYSDAETARYRQISLSSSIPATDAINNKEIVIVRSPEEYRDRYPAIAELHINYGTQAIVAIPLIIEDRVIGAMGISFATPQEFGEADCSFMLTLGRQCAQALERSRLYEAEKEARQVAESANRVKDEFLAVLSHELRSPLNPILGWSKLLRVRKFDPNTTDRALETIERNAKLQAKLIEDLLDVSRILRGKLSLNITPVNLIATVESALETVRINAEAKSIQIKTSLDANAKQVLGDSARLQQVVWNLVSNAVKFTPTGGKIEVRLKAVANQAQIEVIDSGKGIAPEFLPHVFDYFRQADSTTTRKFGGLGLGLAIVRHIVQLHGGTVQAASAGEGLGATFTVRIPLMVAAEKTTDRSENQQSSDLKGIRVLVVDDDLDMREFAAFVLEQSGAEAIVTASANEALQVLSQTQPDVLLSDIGMPEVDGYMLMRQVRMRSPEQGGKIPAIALTAYAGEIDQKQALSAGFQLHIPKPVEPDKLIAAICNLIGR